MMPTEVLAGTVSVATDASAQAPYLGDQLIAVQSIKIAIDIHGSRGYAAHSRRAILISAKDPPPGTTDGRSVDGAEQACIGSAQPATGIATAGECRFSRYADSAGAARGATLRQCTSLSTSSSALDHTSQTRTEQSASVGTRRRT